MSVLKRDLRKKAKREFIVNTVTSGILALYIGLLLGACYCQTPGRMVGEEILNPTLIDALLYLPDYILADSSHLYRLLPTDKISLGTAAMVWLMYVSYCYTMYIRKYNTMYKDAHGSAGFNDDIPTFLRWFVLDPKLVKGWTKKVGSGKRITRKRLRYSIEEKCTAFRSFLCRVTPNTVTPKKLKRCYEKTFLLSDKVALSLNTRWTRRNLNVLVLGASGTGKSRGIIKPNILQANTSLIITDPSGELLMDCGGFLKKKGYVIRIFNLKDLNFSNRYNPVAYVHSQADIPKLVECILSGLNGEQKGNGDNKFWEDAAKNLMTACIAYMFEVYTDTNEFNEDGSRNEYWEGNKNFINVMRMLRMAEVDEEDGGTISALDCLFAELAEKNYNSYAVRQYQIFKMSKDRTAMNILISTAVGLGKFFDNDDFANLSYRDELDLESISRKKTAVFVILPEGDDTYNFFASVMFTQLFQILYAQAERNAREANLPDPFLNVPVQFLVDEAANIGKIPKFNAKLSTIRKYGISVCMIFQTLSQIKEYDKDGWETMTTNCDAWVYLGGSEMSTLKMLSEKIGKATIQTYSYSEGKNNSANRQQIGRNVLDPNEIDAMDNEDCLVFVRGTSPFFDKKYDYSKHANYKFTAGSRSKAALTFQMKKYEIYYNEDEVNQFLIYPYGHPNHTKPRMLSKYQSVKLPIDNFSRKLDNKTALVTKNEKKHWRETVMELTEETEDDLFYDEQTGEKFDTRESATDQTEAVSYSLIMTEEERKLVEEKIKELSSLENLMITEEQFMELLKAPDAITEKEAFQSWCREHLKVLNGYSPEYEFGEEEALLLFLNKV